MHLRNIPIPYEGSALSGLLYEPSKHRKRLGVVLAHGFTAGKYSLDALAAYLAERGYPSLTFDYVGHKLGGSGGEMRRAYQAAENLGAALEWFRGAVEVDAVYLVGHSLGALAVLNIAAVEQGVMPPMHPRLTGIICLCAGRDPSTGFRTSIGQAMLAQRRDYVAGVPAEWIIEELDSMAGAARDIRYPALFIAARQDVIVPIERVQQLATMAGPSAEVQIIDTTHLQAPDASRVAILQWLERVAAQGI